jgi:hypothetical protein
VIIFQFRIGCDTCPTVWPADGWATDRRTAWRTARAAGWARDYEQHRCPACAPSDGLVDRIRDLARTELPDGVIGARLGLSRWKVQNLRTANRIPGRRPGRPRGGTR